MKLLDLIKQFGQANYNYGLFNGTDKLQKQYDAERMDLFKQITEQVSVEPVVKPACKHKNKRYVSHFLFEEIYCRDCDEYLGQC